MTKNELISKLADHEDIGSKVRANRILTFLKETIVAELSAGNVVTLGQDFGTFKPTTREGKTPNTGKPYKTNLVKFSMSAPLKRALNK